MRLIASNHDIVNSFDLRGNQTSSHVFCFQTTEATGLGGRTNNQKIGGEYVLLCTCSPLPPHLVRSFIYYLVRFRFRKEREMRPRATLHTEQTEGLADLA